MKKNKTLLIVLFLLSLILAACNAPDPVSLANSSDTTTIVTSAGTVIEVYTRETARMDVAPKLEDALEICAEEDPNGILASAPEWQFDTFDAWWASSVSGNNDFLGNGGYVLCTYFVTASLEAAVADAIFEEFAADYPFADFSTLEFGDAANAEPVDEASDTSAEIADEAQTLGDTVRETADEASDASAEPVPADETNEEAGSVIVRQAPEIIEVEIPAATLLYGHDVIFYPEWEDPTATALTADMCEEYDVEDGVYAIYSSDAHVLTLDDGSTVNTNGQGAVVVVECPSGFEVSNIGYNTENEHFSISGRILQGGSAMFELAALQREENKPLVIYIAADGTVTFFERTVYDRTLPEDEQTLFLVNVETGEVYDFSQSDVIYEPADGATP